MELYSGDACGREGSRWMSQLAVTGCFELKLFSIICLIEHSRKNSSAIAKCSCPTQHKADCNARDSEQCTPLILAAKKDNDECVATLLPVDSQLRNNTKLRNCTSKAKLKLLTLILAPAARQNTSQVQYCK